jgi:hypothetical protein
VVSQWVISSTWAIGALYELVLAAVPEVVAIAVVEGEPESRGEFDKHAATVAARLRARAPLRRIGNDGIRIKLRWASFRYWQQRPEPRCVMDDRVWRD